MYKHDRLAHFIAALSVTILTAFLEIAWFNPQHPRQAWSDMLEIVAMVGIVIIVAWPRLWWVPLLLTFQEIVVYGAIGYYGVHNTLCYLRWVFGHHWTTSIFGINLYPWVLGPAITFIGEAFMRRRERRKKECPFCGRPNCDYFQTGRCDEQPDHCPVCGGVREFEGGEFYHMLKCPNIPKDGNIHYPHDYMTCPYPQVPCAICEEAASQSRCEGCAGWASEEEGFVHEKGCLKALPGDRAK